MSFREKLSIEIRAVALATLYFALWFSALVTLKEIVLAEYRIGFHGSLKALVGALVVAKVVLVLEYVTLGAWVRKQPVFVDVILRTVLYAFGVLVVLILEKAFEGRHDYGGFGPSLIQVIQHVDIHHVWVNAIGVTGALLGFNVLSVIRRHLGEGELMRLFLLPPREDRGP